MNKHITSRLDGIHSVLCSAFDAGATLTSASKGYEREVFISLFLSEILPPIYRFGSGDIIDSSNNDDPKRQSGQIDIVIEMPWAPSFPTVVWGGTRVYPAEAVGAAIEVKSNLSSQWKEIERTAKKLAPLRQKLSGIAVEGGTLKIDDEEKESIPLYAVGYAGISSAKTAVDKVRNSDLDGILILKHRIFACSDRRQFFKRLKECQDELGKKHSKKPNNLTLATCAKIEMLIRKRSNPREIVRLLNKGDWSLGPTTHFGNNEFLPEVAHGSWTEQNVEAFCKAFLLKTTVHVGTDALLQFVEVIHREVSKRAAMSFNLSDYAK